MQTQSVIFSQLKIASKKDCEIASEAFLMPPPENKEKHPIHLLEVVFKATQCSCKVKYFGSGVSFYFLCSQNDV